MHHFSINSIAFKFSFVPELGNCMYSTTREGFTNQKYFLIHSSTFPCGMLYIIRSSNIKAILLINLLMTGRGG